MPSVLDKRLEDGIEKSCQEQAAATESATAQITEAVKQLDRQMSMTLQEMGNKMDDAAVVNKAGFAEVGQKLEGGFDDLQRTLTTSNDSLGDRFERTLTNSLGSELDAMTNLLQQLIEKQGGKTQVGPAAAVPAQVVLLKREPADQSDEMKPNASKHSTPQGSPQQSPDRAKAKVAHQSVEHTPVTAAPHLKSSDATGVVTNTVNTTGTTPTAATTESRAPKSPDDGMPASKMEDSSNRSTAAASNSIATVAMSSGMTSSQSLPSANPIGMSTYASSSTSSTLPLFPVTPAVVTSLIMGGTQTATTHSQANRIPSDYNATVPPPWGGTSQHTTHTPYYAPYGGTSRLLPAFPGGANWNNPSNHWMGDYDPGRGMYDAGQVNAPPRDDPTINMIRGEVDNIVLVDVWMAMCLIDSVTWTGTGMRIETDRNSNNFRLPSFLSSMEEVLGKAFISSFGKV